jgi:GTP pyrophosphokinase
MAQAPVSIEQLLEKVGAYLPEEKLRLVHDAYAYANHLHAGQVRRSGEPYIQHPVTAAIYLADLNLDAATIAAALLHDVIEDCGATVQELKESFGNDVAQLVDGVTKLTKLDMMAGDDRGTYKPGVDSSQAESLRKMLLAMAEDIRVVLIKLADRLHNMSTLGSMPEERRVAIAQETLEIYAPLAHRLGMGEVKWQLEDLSFHHLQPNQYRVISKLLSSRRQERELYIQDVTEILRRELVKADIQAEVTGRPKHIYGIYRKSQSYAAQGKRLSDIYDLFAVRVLVHDLQDCYGVLGIVHGLWRPMPGQFDDYIANPKENRYQSLHTTVRCLHNMPVEIQVRTHQMHNIAELGVAAHWQYKQGSTPRKDMEFDEKMTWLRQLLEWQRDVTGAEEFLESVKTDIFKDQVFVYTPKGDIKELPSGSTPLDLAYRIHTDLGHRYIGAKINGKLMAMDYQLRNGDTVEVMTSKLARGPSLDWLNSHLGYVKTAGAKQAIRSWFRHQERGANIQRGQDLLKKELRRLSVTIEEIEVARLFRMDSVDDFLASLGSGVTSTAQVAGRLSALQDISEIQDAEHEEVSLNGSSAGIEVLGVGDLLTHMGLCCHPLPGDPIIGYVTRTRGVTIHRGDCPNIRHSTDRERMVEVSWGRGKHLYPVRVGIEAWDRVGLLRDVTVAVATEGINMLSVVTQVHDDATVSIFLTVQVQGMEQVSRLFSRVEGVRGVSSMLRMINSKNPPGSKVEDISKLH